VRQIGYYQEFTSQLICASFRNRTEQRGAVCGQKAVLHVTCSNFMALEH